MEACRKSASGASGEEACSATRRPSSAEASWGRRSASSQIAALYRDLSASAWRGAPSAIPRKVAAHSLQLFRASCSLPRSKRLARSPSTTTLVERLPASEPGQRAATSSSRRRASAGSPYTWTISAAR